MKPLNDDVIHISYNNDNEKHSMNADSLLIPTGTVPAIQQLNLESSHVETDKRGYIKVNGNMKTSISGIYALGDIKGGPQAISITGWQKWMLTILPAQQNQEMTKVF